MTKVRVFGKGEQSPKVGDIVTFQVTRNPGMVGTARVRAEFPEDEYGLKRKTHGRVVYEWPNGEWSSCAPGDFGPWRLATAREVAAYESAAPDLHGSALADQLYSGWRQWEQTKSRAGATPGIPGIGRRRSGDA